jgi:hypothetical protein
MMFMKECGNKIKRPVFVSSANRIALRNKAEKELKFGLTEAIILEIFQMELNKVWEFTSGQMVLDTKVIGLLTKCQGEVHLSGPMVVTLKVNLKTG